MYSAIDVSELPDTGFPIQRSPAQCLLNGSPKLIAVNHVFHRHPTPRHPPFALNSLAINIRHLCQYAFFGAFENVLPCIQLQMYRHYPTRVSPFRDLRVKVCLATHRSLSQLTTSFIASWCQGIHRLPLIAWPQNN